MNNTENSDSPIIQENGQTYIRLSDGRYWCPSRQFRDGSPTKKNIKQVKSKRYVSNNNKYLTEKYNSFVAVDFETATYQKDICQIGIVSVEDKQIVNKLTLLIQPPSNKYDIHTINIHHITPKDTENKKKFDEIWPDIKQYFEGKVLVAHNASFDESALLYTLQYYNIDSSRILPFICTCTLYKNKASIMGINIKASLEDLCYAFSMDYSNHHDALFDAECCAQFYLNYLNDIEPQYDLILRNNTGKYITSNSYLSPLFDKKPSTEIKSFFEKKKCVITGEFDVEREILKSYFENLGAKFTGSISSATDYVIIGENPGPSKLHKIQELQQVGSKIKSLYPEDIINLLNPKQE